MSINSRASGWCQTVLSDAGAWAEGHPWSSLSVVLLVYLLQQMGTSLHTPLWHDELFTYWISQASSLPQMFAEIRTIDLNPPLSYLLTRASFRLFGIGTLQTRLPEILGFGIALVSMFAFIRRRTGNAFGLLVAALLVGSRTTEEAVQARPYGLLLGMTAAALAFWQASSDEPEQKGSWADLGLFVSLCLMLLTHVFSALSWGVLAGAEVVQIYLRRRIDVARTLSMLLPLGVVITWIPLLRDHAQSSFPATFSPNGKMFVEFYSSHINRDCLCVLLTAALTGVFVSRSWLRGSPRFALSLPEWVAVSGFFVTPAILMGYLLRSHAAFWPRYGAVAALGTAAMLSVILCWWAGRRSGVAVLCVAVTLVISGRAVQAAKAARQGSHLFRNDPRFPPLDTRLLTRPDLPLVDDSGLSFLEMQRGEPAALLAKTYFLTDAAAAVKYAHATIYNGMPEEQQMFHLAGHVEPYAAFTAEHAEFYVFGSYSYPENWLLRKLRADGAQVQLLGLVGGDYYLHEVYLVQLASH